MRPQLPDKSGDIVGRSVGHFAEHAPCARDTEGRDGKPSWHMLWPVWPAQGGAGDGSRASADEWNKDSYQLRNSDCVRIFDQTQEPDLAAPGRMALTRCSGGTKRCGGKQWGGLCPRVRIRGGRVGGIIGVTTVDQTLPGQ